MGLSAAAGHRRPDAGAARLAEADGGPRRDRGQCHGPRGVEPALAAAWIAIILEIGGGILIALGLFTRPVALLLVLEFVVIVKTHLAAGWAVGNGGAEFAFLWTIVLVYILARGGGYSVDAKPGREF